MSNEKLTTRQIERIIQHWRRCDAVRYEFFEFMVLRASRAIGDLQLTAARREGELKQVRTDAFHVANDADDPAQEMRWYERV